MRGKPFHRGRPQETVLCRNWDWFWVGYCRINCEICLRSNRGTSENIDVLANQTHRMSLHSLVGQTYFLLYFLPTEYPSVEVLWSCGRRTVFDLYLVGCLDCDFFVIDHDEIVESSQTVDSSWIFLVHKVLVAVLELKLISSVGY